MSLEILLAVIFACGSLSYPLTEMRHNLPHSPHTIAGSMPLLAGSEIASRSVVPEGAKFMSARQLKKAGVFEG
jgi:hypothetical protein